MLFEVNNLQVDIDTAGGALHAVRDASFSLAKGETLGIAGESGSGKTLTALALMGLLPRRARRRAATLRFGERDLLAMSEGELAAEIRGNRIAMIFQEPMTSLNPVYTIGRQLTEAMTLHQRVRKGSAVERAVYLLEKVGIPAAASRLSQYPHQLSGGQRQRVMIAMALMNAPELIIADEPTTALDVTIQAQILRLLASLQRELGMAMILITHNLGVVARVADRVAIMYAGEIVECAPTADLFANPRHPYTQGLLDCLHLGSIPGIVPSLVGDVRGCAFAPRCPHALPGCKTDAPPIRQRGAGHIYRCVLPDEPRSSMATASAATATAPFESPVMLGARNVSASYEVGSGFLRKQTLHALRDVTLELRKGELFALVGESGCGKSTLARVLLGLLEPQSGDLQLAGPRRVQPVFQDPYSSLNPRKTVAEIIRRPLDLHRIGTPAQRRREVARMMALTGLPERLAAAYPNQISGGQRQRVAIARAIIMKPEIVLCDEPTSALDVSVQSQILKLLLELREELGLTYLFITHDLSVVRQLATRVAVMYLGEIVEIGDARSVLDTPRHPYTRALLESVMTVAPGAGVPDARIGHSFPNPLEIPAGCAFHPRCPAAMPECASVVPQATHHGGVTVRCHLYGPGSAPDEAGKG